MNNRKKKKGIKMSFIMMARENGDTKHDALYLNKRNYEENQRRSKAATERTV